MDYLLLLSELPEPPPRCVLPEDLLLEAGVDRSTREDDPLLTLVGVELRTLRSCVLCSRCGWARSTRCGCNLSALCACGRSARCGCCCTFSLRGVAVSRVRAAFSLAFVLLRSTGVRSTVLGLRSLVLLFVLPRSTAVREFAFLLSTARSCVRLSLFLIVLLPSLSIRISRVALLAALLSAVFLPLFLLSSRAVVAERLSEDVTERLDVLLLSRSGRYIDTLLLSVRDAPGRSDCLTLLTSTRLPIARSISLREGPP